jgi:hypothetical protein
MTLGSALRTRSEENGSEQDLDEALLLCRTASNSCPLDDAILPECLNRLGRVLSITFQRQGSMDVIQEAIQVHRRAMELCEADNSEYTRSMASCATALWLLFGKQGGLEHLDKTVALYQKTIEQSHAGDPTETPMLQTSEQTLPPDTGPAGISLTWRSQCIGKFVARSLSATWEQGGS